MPTLRIVHFSHSDGPGGAGRATLELHRALRAAGCESTVFVQRKTSDDEDIKIVPTRWLLNFVRTVQRILPRALPSRRHQIFNADRVPAVDSSEFFALPKGSVDVIYLHWIARLLSSRLVAEIAEYYGCPVVWIPMDAEPVTGGCHYTSGCQGFKSSCGCCPVLRSTSEQDRSRVVWLNKQKFLSHLPIRFVSATSWMTTLIRSSSLFGEHQIEDIALPIDTTVFSPEGRHEARMSWGFHAADKIVLIGAQLLKDPRKGMRELLLALNRLNALLGESGVVPAREPTLLVIGSGPEVFANELPFPVRFVDRIADKRKLASAYRTADVYVCPSLDDAGPMMIPEAMLCGTPVVAFEMGGAPDLIENGVTGYMARLGNIDELARGLFNVLYGPAVELGANAHRAAYERHNPALVTARHVAFCRRIVAGSRGEGQAS